MMPIRVAVIGAGHLGKIHTRLLLQQKGIQLISIAEPNPSSQKQIADEFNLPLVADYRNLLPEIDAAIVATPTPTHFDVTSTLLRAGKHVLVEKPLTDSVSTSEALVGLAEMNNCVVQVGHVERFNPVLKTALAEIGQPKFVLSNRMSGYSFRSTDVGIVHDLMIHDIDLVNSMFHGRLLETRAIGISVFGRNEDIAQARLHFSCGSVANLTASRCSYVNDRSMQIFGTEGFASIDFVSSKVTIVSVPPKIRNRNFNLFQTTMEQQAFLRDHFFEEVLPKKEILVDKVNAIALEQKDWIDAIRFGDTPRITVQQGCQAVQIAQSILDSMAAHRWSQSDPITTGPHGIINRVHEIETRPQKKAA